MSRRRKPAAPSPPDLRVEGIPHPSIDRQRKAACRSSLSRGRLIRMTRSTILTLVLAVYIAFLFDIALLHFPATNPRPNLIPFQSMLHDGCDLGLM